MDWLGLVFTGFAVGFIAGIIGTARFVTNKFDLINKITKEWL